MGVIWILIFVIFQALVSLFTFYITVLFDGGDAGDSPLVFEQTVLYPFRLEIESNNMQLEREIEDVGGVGGRSWLRNYWSRSL